MIINDLQTFYFLHVNQLRSISWQKRIKPQPIAVDWPQILNSDHVTRLILLQELHKLGLVDYSPLDDPEFVVAIGGEGVEAGRPAYAETGPTSQKNFLLLERLKELEIYKIVLRPLDEFERRVLVRVQFYVEAEWKRRRDEKTRWENSKNRRRARWKRAQKKQREKVMATKKANEELKTVSETEKEPVKAQENVYGQPGEKEAQEEPKPPRTIEPSRPEVELEVMRVGPNPRVLVCEYKLLADRIRVNVFVKTNTNFRRGMKFKMREQEGGDWGYQGRLPRFAGRW